MNVRLYIFESIWIHVYVCQYAYLKIIEVVFLHICKCMFMLVSIHLFISRGQVEIFNIRYEEVLPSVWDFYPLKLSTANHAIPRYRTQALFHEGQNGC